MIGVACLIIFVPDLRPRRQDAEKNQAAEVHKRLATTAGRKGPSLWLLFDVRLGRLLAAAAILGVLTIGDGFIYLTPQSRDRVATELFPLLYVGTNFAYMALAIPLGRLADRYGKARVYLTGHLALLAAYAMASVPSGEAATIGCLVFLGTFYAATDGVLAALSGRLADPAVRASGIGTAQTVVAVARFVSSVGFGLLWVQLGSASALWVVGSGLAVGLVLCTALLLPLDREAAA